MERINRKSILPEEKVLTLFQQTKALSDAAKNTTLTTNEFLESLKKEWWDNGFYHPDFYIPVIEISKALPGKFYSDFTEQQKLKFIDIIAAKHKIDTQKK